MLVLKDVFALVNSAQKRTYMAVSSSHYIAFKKPK